MPVYVYASSGSQTISLLPRGLCTELQLVFNNGTASILVHIAAHVCYVYAFSAAQQQA